jgi:transcriptional regulator with XRE-family HTH domain
LIKEIKSSFREYRGKVFFTLPGLKRERETQRISQERLAAITGVSQGIILRIEHGERTTPETFSKLVRALDVEPDALIYGDDSSVEVTVES